jgi:hypothetical protein
MFSAAFFIAKFVGSAAAYFAVCRDNEIIYKRDGI